MRTTHLRRPGVCVAMLRRELTRPSWWLTYPNWLLCVEVLLRTTHKHRYMRKRKVYTRNARLSMSCHNYCHQNNFMVFNQKVVKIVSLTTKKLFPKSCHVGNLLTTLTIFIDILGCHNDYTGCHHDDYCLAQKMLLGLLWQPRQPKSGQYWQLFDNSLTTLHFVCRLF